MVRWRKLALLPNLNRNLKIEKEKGWTDFCSLLLHKCSLTIEVKQSPTSTLKKRLFLLHISDVGYIEFTQKEQCPIPLGVAIYRNRNSYNTFAKTEKLSLSQNDTCMPHVCFVMLLDFKPGRSQLKMIKQYSVEYFSIKIQRIIGRTMPLCPPVSTGLMYSSSSWGIYLSCFSNVPYPSHEKL